MTEQYRSSVSDRWNWAAKCRVALKNWVGNELVVVEPAVSRSRSGAKEDKMEFALKASWKFVGSGSEQSKDSSSSNFCVYGYASNSVPLETPYYSLWQLSQLDQEISSKGAIMFGPSCGEESTRGGEDKENDDNEEESRVAFTVRAMKSDAQRRAENAWLEGLAGSSSPAKGGRAMWTRLMWECARRVENGYEYAPECERLWKSFTELHLLEAVLEPKLISQASKNTNTKVSPLLRDYPFDFATFILATIFMCEQI